MTRLTNLKRDKLIQKAVDSADFNMDHLKELEVIKDLVYKEIVPKRVSDLLGQLTPQEQEEHLAYRSRRYVALSDGSTYYLEFDDKERFPFVPKKSGAVRVSDKLTTRIEKVVKEEARVKELRRQLYIDIRSIVYAVNTVKQLLEIWPECESLLPAKEAPAQALVDPKVFKRINELCHLEKKT